MLTSASRPLARSALMARTASVLPTTQQAFFATKSGRVKWFDTKKGYGFIIADDDASELFVHHSNIHAEGFRSLAEGEPVEFESIKGDTGRADAIRVTGPKGVFVRGSPQPGFVPRGPAFGGGYGGGYGAGGYGGGYGAPSRPGYLGGYSAPSQQGYRSDYGVGYGAAPKLGYPIGYPRHGSGDYGAPQDGFGHQFGGPPKGSIPADDNKEDKSRN